MKNKTIIQIHNDLINRNYSIEELVNSTLTLIKKNALNNDHVFLSINYQEAIDLAKTLDKNIDKNKDNLLYGIPFSLKDNICVKNSINTAGSKFLSNYLCPYDSFVNNLLRNSNAVLIGKTNMDELGFGGTGLHSGFGDVLNPIDNNRISGGSSSGSAVSVKNGTSVFSIGTDTGDSIRNPASNLGICGFKPSYGMISRYGVISYSSSLDHVGILANNVTDISIVMDSIAKFDNQDYTSVNQNIQFYKNLSTKQHLKLIVYDDVFNLVDENIKSDYLALIAELETKYEIIHKNFGIDLINILFPIYRVISNVEGLSNISNLNGILFGKQENNYSNYKDLMINSRSQNFGFELKKRLILACWYSSTQNFNDIYMKANKIRNIIVNKINNDLKGYDAVLLPGSHNVAGLVDDVKDQLIYNSKNIHRTDDYQYSPYANDTLLLANFAGLPSIVIPFGNDKNNLPFGINITGNKNDDLNVINVAFTIEKFLEGN